MLSARFLDFVVTLHNVLVAETFLYLSCCCISESWILSAPAGQTGAVGRTDVVVEVAADAKGWIRLLLVAAPNLALLLPAEW